MGPPKGNRKPQGKAIFGKAITKAPTPLGELELDMGMVVVVSARFTTFLSGPCLGLTLVRASMEDMVVWR